MKRFQYDQGKEYAALSACFRRNGIVQISSTACTPESNGVAESYNRSLLQESTCIALGSWIQSEILARSRLARVLFDQCYAKAS